MWLCAIGQLRVKIIHPCPVEIHDLQAYTLVGLHVTSHISQPTVPHVLPCLLKLLTHFTAQLKSKKKRMNTLSPATTADLVHRLHE